MSASEGPVQDGCPICAGTPRAQAGGLTRWHDEGHPHSTLPTRLAMDAAGYVWRIFEGAVDGVDMWSMPPGNPDNAPVPGPVTYFDPASRVSATEPAPPAARTLGSLTIADLGSTLVIRDRGGIYTGELIRVEHRRFLSKLTTYVHMTGEDGWSHSGEHAHDALVEIQRADEGETG